MSRYPPEWERQSTVWLSWSSYGIQSRHMPVANEVIADMAAALVLDSSSFTSASNKRLSTSNDARTSADSSTTPTRRDTKLGPVPSVTLLVSNHQDVEDAKEKLEARDVPLDRVKMVTVERHEEWIRDFGPIFVKQGAELKVASFGWNHWGTVGRHQFEGIEATVRLASLVSKACASHLDLKVVESSLVSEGGNREFNGAGVLMATAAVELQRNPSLDLETIEKELTRIFDVQKVIWLGEGLADDDHAHTGPRRHAGLLEFNAGATGGHIDEFCKFLSPTKVLLAEVIEEERETSLGKITHARMERNLEILKSSSSTTIEGEPFEIIRIPTPPTLRLPINKDDPIWEWFEGILFDNGGHPQLGKDLMQDQERAFVVLPASYVNMIICNGTIIIPRYGRAVDEEKWSFVTDEQNALALKTDDQAKCVLQTQFPSYNIIQIPSVLALNLGGGGMHCCSQQQPE